MNKHILLNCLKNNKIAKIDGMGNCLSIRSYFQYKYNEYYNSSFIKQYSKSFKNIDNFYLCLTILEQEFTGNGSGCPSNYKIYDYQQTQCGVGTCSAYTDSNNSTIDLSFTNNLQDTDE